MANVAVASNSLQTMLANESVKKRFDEVLGKKAPAFMSSLLSVVNNEKLLQKADPKTILSAGMIAATMDLPVNQNLGCAWIIPYGNQAQFIMGYKGYIQLAMRSGKYTNINACKVYEGMIKSENPFTGTFEFGEKTSDRVVGYMAYFKLINGFEKYLYMSIEQMQAHAKKYSKTYKGGTEKWGITDFDSMAIKTVLSKLLRTYGILSIEMKEMATAVACDGAVIRETEAGEFEPVPTYDMEATEVKEPEVVDVEALEPDEEAGF